MAKKRELSNRQFVEEFIDFFPPARALQLVAFCGVYRLWGYPPAKQLARERRHILGLKRGATYRCLVDLRRFREHLLEQGYERPGITDAASNPHEAGLDELAEVVDRELVDRVAGVVQEVGQQGSRAGTVPAAAAR